ncbi:hypothetical protein PanWU01x14_154520, partial [Parasponia andersonii]
TYRHSDGPLNLVRSQYVCIFLPSGINPPHRCNGLLRDSSIEVSGNGHLPPKPSRDLLSVPSSFW